MTHAGIETDILDVWFDSGSTHAFVLRDREDGSEDGIADLYLEGSDQHRGWFQTSMLPGLGSTGVSPFRTVVTHGFMVTAQGQKMSKSLGNAITLKEIFYEGTKLLEKTFEPVVIRHFVLTSHYRQPLDWSEETIRSSKRMLDRLYGAVRGIEISDEARAAGEPPEALVAALEDDINTPRAMAEFFALAKDLNKEADAGEKARLAAEMYAAGDLMGLLQSDPEEWFAGDVEGELSANDIEALIGKRNAARKDKDFATADAVRDQLSAAGIKIEDGPEGTTWRRDD